VVEGTSPGESVVSPDEELQAINDKAIRFGIQRMESSSGAGEDERRRAWPVSIERDRRLVRLCLSSGGVNLNFTVF
jgi:hypothetical protein